MKLIFLGDSFTWGWGIEIEYALQKKILNSEKYYFNKKMDKDIFIKINNWRKENVWTSLLSNDLGLMSENLSVPAANLQSIFLQIINHKDDCNCFYLIFLPYHEMSRILISSKNNKNYFIDESSILNLFNTLIIREKEKDFNFFKKYYDKNLISFIEFQSFLNIIMFLKNNRKKFLILPSWRKTIEEHYLLDQDKKIKKLYQDYIFNEIKDFLNFNFSPKISYLPCEHPDISSQINIKNEYIDYIREKIYENN